MNNPFSLWSDESMDDWMGSTSRGFGFSTHRSFFSSKVKQDRTRRRLAAQWFYGVSSETMEKAQHVAWTNTV